MPMNALTRNPVRFCNCWRMVEHAGQISERMGIDKRRVYWVRDKLRRRFGAKTNEHFIQRAAAEGFIYPRD